MLATGLGTSGIEVDVESTTFIQLAAEMLDAIFTILQGLPFHIN